MSKCAHQEHPYAHLLGGRKSATKFFGTPGRSSWALNCLRLFLSYGTGLRSTTPVDLAPGEMATVNSSTCSP